MSIEANVKSLLKNIPEHVTVVAAAKNKSPEQIEKVIQAGIEVVGENYIQEAEKAFVVLGRKVKWHFIGHLQTNKVTKAIQLFDLIETVDSVEIAQEIDTRCAHIGKIMPVLCELNIAREKTKSGILPEEIEKFMLKIACLQHIKILGLMTMGPLSANPEEIRIYFKKTKQIFDDVQEKSIPHIHMEHLSMGMSNSYKIAIEEGANIVRIGTRIFGARKP